MNKSSEAFVLMTLTLSIFFISLISLPGNVQRLGVVLFILLSFVVLKKNKLNVDIKIVILVIFLMFISITRFIYAYVYETWLQENNENFILSYVLNFSLYFFFSLLANNMIRFKSEFIAKSLFIVILCHLFLFYIQFVSVYVSGYFIDYVKFFTGEDTRYMTYLSQLGPLKYRSSGAYIEPSTYAGCIILLLLTYELTSKTVCNKVRWLAVFSIFLTFSSVGIILVAIYLCSKLKKSISSFKFYTFFIIGTSIVFINILFFYEQLILIFNSPTFLMRIELVNYILSRETDLLLIGPGLFSLENELFTLSSGEHLGELRLASINDLGLGVLLFIKLGFIGFGLYLLSFCYVKNKIDYICITLTKLSYMHPLFLLALVSLFRNKH